MSLFKDVDNTPWPPGASSSTSQQLPIAGLYNAPGELLHSHPPSVSASDSFDYKYAYLLSEFSFVTHGYSMKVTEPYQY